MINKTPKKTLKNDGELELFFLGVGSAFAMKNYQTNFFIIKGDSHILVDFGSYAPIALKNNSEIKIEDIEFILPTHSHNDHIGGLENIALTNRYVAQKFMGKPKTKMIIDENYQRILWDYSLRGGLEWNEIDGMAHKLQFSDYFDVVRPTWKIFSPRETFMVDIGDIHIEMFRTNHIPEQSNKWEASFISYGLMIDNKVFVSGDTQFDEELIETYKDAEIMFHDVQFFPGAVHAPLEDLKTLPEEIKGKMHLIHYADSYDKQDIAGFAGWAQQGVSYIFN